MTDFLPDEHRKVWWNTGDAMKRPKEISPGEPMVLDLPDDVKVEPSVRDLSRLRKRMVTYEGLAAKMFAGGRIPTDSTPLPDEFGGISILIALDRSSLVGLEKEYSSKRTASVNNLVASAPDPTHIPPIYLDVNVDIGAYVMDGHHRVISTLKDDRIPYLLAYVKKDDLGFLEKAGFVYRKVQTVSY